jgi:hypothetical protein
MAFPQRLVRALLVSAQGYVVRTSMGATGRFCVPPLMR